PSIDLLAQGLCARETQHDRDGGDHDENGVRQNPIALRLISIPSVRQKPRKNGTYNNAENKLHSEVADRKIKKKAQEEEFFSPNSRGSPQRDDQHQTGNGQEKHALQRSKVRLLPLRNEPQI